MKQDKRRRIQHKTLDERFLDSRKNLNK